MKRFIQSPGFLIAFIFLAILGIAATTATTTRYNNSGNRTYKYSASLDTLTNTANDTINIDELLTSQWTYNWQINCTNISGTTNIIAILQESNNNSNWYEVERDTAATTEILRLHGSELNADPDNNVLGYVKGLYQRLILDGGGTHSTSYTVDCVMKKE